MPQVYANDRAGNLSVLSYPTPSATLTGYPYALAAGPANAGLAYDGTYVYLPGIYNGSLVQMGIVTPSSSPSQPTATPVTMPSGSFRPILALYNSTAGYVFTADYASFISALNPTGFVVPSHYPIVPASLAGLTPGTIQAQGLAINPNGGSPQLLTCFQDSSGADHLAVISSLTGTPTATAYSLTSIALTNSYTGIAVDPQSGTYTGHPFSYITSNNPQGNCLTVLNGSYSPITGSPFSTSGSDARGVYCITPSATPTVSFLFVCNFASNSLAIFQNSAGTLTFLGIVDPRTWTGS